MSHYAEYLHGSMDEDEFRFACQMEFAGDNEEPFDPDCDEDLEDDE